MKTIIGLANSNCSWCLNAMAERLADRPLVNAVHVNAAAGCLEVDHDHDDPEALVVQIHDDLRGWVTADNGEAVMVDLDVHEETACRLASSKPSDAGNVEESPQGEFASLPLSIRFDPDRPVVANVVSHRSTTVFAVCLDVGQELAPHPAPAELTLMIMEGQPTITVAEAARLSAPGDVVAMGEGVMHSLSAGSQRTVVVGILQAKP